MCGIVGIFEYGRARGSVSSRVINRPKQGFGAPVDAWLQSKLGTLFERLIDT